MKKSDGISPIDENSINIVTQSCSVDKGRAMALLLSTKGDPEKSMMHHKMVEKYRAKLKPKTAKGAALTSSLPQVDSSGGLAESHPPSGRTRSSSASIERNSFQSCEDVDNDERNKRKVTGDLPGLYSEKHQADPSPEAHQGTEELQGEWDFVLPVIPLQINNIGAISLEQYESFDLRVLIAALQNGADRKTIQNYLNRFDKAKMRELLKRELDGFPAMFYVVETNKEDMLRMFVNYGGDPAAIHQESSIPLLAFAIMHSENIQTDTTIITATLLSLGSVPTVIPSAFYSPYLQDLPDTAPGDGALENLADENQKWCKGAARTKLARTATLSQRYYLERASKIKKPSVRQIQVAQKRNAEPLLGIANFLIGQNVAAKMLLDKLLSHLTVPSTKPLVLVFAGPSGHGKTELARRLGTLLSLELEVVDCTIFNRENELFGPRQPYVGWEKGSRLNNFLSSNHNQSCIVFLDEFEKTNADIHKTLLLPFDNGEYQDRRGLNKINCSKTIWILATNAHDSTIKDFWTVNSGTLSLDHEGPKKEFLLKQLSRDIKQDFLSNHGSPVTGRISGFIPFLPFSIGEQAVIVHKNLLELGRHIRMPVNLLEGSLEQLIGDMRMRIPRDASVCEILAQSEYHIDLGARSLIGAVDTIKTLLVEAYLAVDETIKEGGDISDVMIDANDGEVVVHIVPQRLR